MKTRSNLIQLDLHHGLYKKTRTKQYFLLKQQQVKKFKNFFEKNLNSLTFLVDFFEFCIDTLEECEGWIRSFSVATGVKPSNKDGKYSKPQASGKDFRKAIKKNTSISNLMNFQNETKILIFFVFQSGSVAAHDRNIQKELYYKCELDFPVINECNAFSKLIDVEESPQGFWDCNLIFLLYNSI